MSSPTPPTRRRHFEGGRVSDRTRRSSSPASARTGRANFDPYWKLSTVSPRTLSWVEAKGTYWTADAARSSAPDLAEEGELVRLVRVAPEGRTVVEEFRL